MKKQKGFTLIELLAIIVILAIIAVITVPIILNVIDNAKRGTAKDSAYGYKDAINKYYVASMLESENVKLDDTYNVVDGKLGDYEIPFSGTKPTSGYLTYENNMLISGCLTIDEYKVSFLEGEVDKVDVGECDGNSVTSGPTTETPNTTELQGVIKIVYLDPTDLTKTCYKADSDANVLENGFPTGVKEGCMKWYAYKEDAETYTMILDHNTTAKVSWNLDGDKSEGMVEVQDALNADMTNWDIKGRLITANEVAEITKNKSFDLNTASTNNYFYLESNTTTSPSSYTGIYSWLLDYSSSCTYYGCKVSDSSTDGYWTSDLLNDGTARAWYVRSYGSLYYDGIGNAYGPGVRPVLTISKSIIFEDK